MTSGSRVLHARGVEVVFGIPGVHTVELYRGLSGSPLRHVTARHEQGCAFMADGYARVSGKPGVAFVITGPGLTERADGDGRNPAPIQRAGAGDFRREPSCARWALALGLLHELPDHQAAMVRHALPHPPASPQASEVAEVLDWAFATMATGRPGPVHIEVPTDVMPLPCAALPAPKPLAAQTLAPLAEKAGPAPQPNCSTPPQRVVILAGGGARGLEMRPCKRLGRETLDAPVVQTTNARGHAAWPSALTVPASPSLASATRALIADGADQVLAIGTELGQTDYDMNMRWETFPIYRRHDPHRHLR